MPRTPKTLHVGTRYLGATPSGRLYVTLTVRTRHDAALDLSFAGALTRNSTETPHSVGQLRAEIANISKPAEYPPGMPELISSYWLEWHNVPLDPAQHLDELLAMTGLFPRDPRWTPSLEHTPTSAPEQTEAPAVSENKIPAPEPIPAPYASGDRARYLDAPVRIPKPIVHARASLARIHPDTSEGDVTACGALVHVPVRLVVSADPQAVTCTRCKAAMPSGDVSENEPRAAQAHCSAESYVGRDYWTCDAPRDHYPDTPHHDPATGIYWRP